MKIDEKEVRRIADLAHLELGDAATQRMAAELTKILTYIDQLNEVDVSGIAEYGAADATPMRDDEVRPSVHRDLVAANAPAWRDGAFVVPKVIGGE